MNIEDSASINQDCPLLLRAHVRAFHDRIEHDESTILVPFPRGLWTKKADFPFHLRSEIFLQIGGACAFDFPSQRIVIRPGDALVVPAGMPHKERASDCGPDLFCNIVYMLGDAFGGTVHLAGLRRNGACVASGKFLPYPIYMENLSEARFYPVVGEELGKFHEESLPETEKLRKSLLCGLLQRSLIDLSDVKSGGNVIYCNDVPPEGGRHYKVLLAQRIINEHVRGRMPSVRELAEAVKCSPNHLSSLFRKSVGTTIKSYVNNVKLEYACRQLETTTYNIAEIAWACGFQDASYFSRIFRRRFGKNPEDVRAGRRG